MCREAAMLVLERVRVPGSGRFWLGPVFGSELVLKF